MVTYLFYSYIVVILFVLKELKNTSLSGNKESCH